MLAISCLPLASHFRSCSVTLMSPQNHFQRVLWGFHFDKKLWAFAVFFSISDVFDWTCIVFCVLLHQFSICIFLQHVWPLRASILIRLLLTQSSQAFSFSFFFVKKIRLVVNINEALLSLLNKSFKITPQISVLKHCQVGCQVSRHACRMTFLEPTLNHWKINLSH